MGLRGEDWVKQNLRIDKKKLRDDELYADYFEKFVKLTDLHNWNNWTSWLLGSSPCFHKDIFESLQKIPDYIISRIWPKRYPDLEMAFINFKSVLNDLMKVYHEYPGLREFMKNRETRDLNFGSGIEEYYFSKHHWNQ